MNKEDYFNIDELRAYLIDHPSKHTVNKWRSEGKIPYIIVGKKAFYNKKTIAKWDKNGRKGNN